MGALWLHTPQWGQLIRPNHGRANRKSANARLSGKTEFLNILQIITAELWFQRCELNSWHNALAFFKPFYNTVLNWVVLRTQGIFTKIPRDVIRVYKSSSFPLHLKSYIQIHANVDRHGLLKHKLKWGMQLWICMNLADVLISFQPYIRMVSK